MQDGTHCRSSWKGSAQASSDDACSGCQVHQGSPQRMRQKHCKTPRPLHCHGCGLCFFCLVFQFVQSIRFVRHSFFGSRKEPRIHITILQEAMHWIKEVEMVDSVDDVMSSSSMRGFQMPKFEVFDVRIASALNRIIRDSHFKRRIGQEEQKAQKQDRFFRGRQIAYLIYDYFGSLGAMILPRTTPTYSLLLFEMMIFRNSILSGTEFYCP